VTSALGNWRGSRLLFLAKLLESGIGAQRAERVDESYRRDSIHFRTDLVSRNDLIVGQDSSIVRDVFITTT